MTSRVSNIINNSEKTAKDFMSEDFSQIAKHPHLLDECYTTFYGYFKFSDFDISETNFRVFVSSVKDKYLDNPYHNFSHAMDACNTLVYLLSNITLQFSKLDKLALFIAMLCHDVGHFGRTGSFVMEHRKDLTQIYSSTSPLEEFHLFSTIEILEKTRLFDHFDDEDKTRVIHVITQTIFATDPATTQHFLDQLVCSHSETEEQYMHNLKLIIKCADIGSSIKVFSVHRIWSELLMEEFYAQGHEIKLLSGQCPALFDFDKRDDFFKSQVWFFDNYANKLYEKISPHLTSDTAITNLKRNREIWSKM